jgi:hypothetical protein
VERWKKLLSDITWIISFADCFVQYSIDIFCRLCKIMLGGS